MLHDVSDEHTTKDCTQWDQWENYTTTQKQNLMSFAMSNFDALQVSSLFFLHSGVFLTTDF